MDKSSDETVRAPRGTMMYHVTTSTCLVLGVVSAFGFDHYNHPGWLVLGGVSAIVAIAAYFGRHWQRASEQEAVMTYGVERGETADPAAGWETAFRDPRASQGSTKSIADMHVWALSTQRHGVSAIPSEDPAEIAARLLKRLQEDARPSTIVIGADGSIELTVEGVGQKRRRLGAAQLQVPSLETVH